MGTPCFSPRSATLATLSTAHKVRPFGSSASNGVHLRGVIATKGDLARLHLMTKDNRRREANGDRSGSVKLILDQHIASRPKTTEKHLYPGFTKRSKMKKRILKPKIVKIDQKWSFFALLTHFASKVRNRHQGTCLVQPPSGARPGARRRPGAAPAPPQRDDGEGSG